MNETYFSSPRMLRHIPRMCRAGRQRCSRMWRRGGDAVVSALTVQDAGLCTRRGGLKRAQDVQGSLDSTQKLFMNEFRTDGCQRHVTGIETIIDLTIGEARVGVVIEWNLYTGPISFPTTTNKTK
jgi:hypothetical protein